MLQRLAALGLNRFSSAITLTHHTFLSHQLNVQTSILFAKLNLTLILPRYAREGVDNDTMFKKAQSFLYSNRERCLAILDL